MKYNEEVFSAIKNLVPHPSTAHSYGNFTLTNQQGYLPLEQCHLHFNMCTSRHFILALLYPLLWQSAFIMKHTVGKVG